MSVPIACESTNDASGIQAVHCAAFPTSAEADLVRMLHEDLDSVISLVARDADRIIGHIMLSRMRAVGRRRPYRALGLAPLAVLPHRQKEGIGAALVMTALEHARRNGEEIVFVLGDPGYYRRFGFTTEAARHFTSPYAGPHFMALPFGTALPSTGTAAYAPAFARLG